MTTRYPLDSLRAHPPYLAPAYVATRTRAPKQAPIVIPHSMSELTGPLFGHASVSEPDSDLTRQHSGEPLGQRIVVAGKVMDEDGRAIPHTLIEIWQANAAGRYVHPSDQHPAPLDPNFTGAGRCLTDAEGRYRFVTIKPGAYPWKNHHNAWRPNHIHFSLFGPSFLSRLVTQMYFPGDPLIPLDPIAMAVGDMTVVDRMIAKLDLNETMPDWAIGYRFDIVLRGRRATPFEEPHDE
jgi:protocatechuate 3,4-dioxygenase beta subunit